MSLLLTFCLGAVLPPADGLPGVKDCNVRDFLKRLRREAPLLFRLSLYGSALVLVLCPLFTIFVPLPAFLLPRSLLEAHVTKMSASRFYGLRQALLMVKTVAGMCWGADANVRTLIGLRPYGEDPGTWRTE